MFDLTINFAEPATAFRGTGFFKTYRPATLQTLGFLKRLGELAEDGERAKLRLHALFPEFTKTELNRGLRILRDSDAMVIDRDVPDGALCDLTPSDLSFPRPPRENIDVRLEHRAVVCAGVSLYNGRHIVDLLTSTSECRGIPLPDNSGSDPESLHFSMSGTEINRPNMLKSLVSDIISEYRYSATEDVSDADPELSLPIDGDFTRFENITSSTVWHNLPYALHIGEDLLCDGATPLTKRDDLFPIGEDDITDAVLRAQACNMTLPEDASEIPTEDLRDALFAVHLTCLGNAAEEMLAYLKRNRDSRPDVMIASREFCDEAKELHRLDPSIRVPAKVLIVTGEQEFGIVNTMLGMHVVYVSVADRKHHVISDTMELHTGLVSLHTRDASVRLSAAVAVKPDRGAGRAALSEILSSLEPEQRDRVLDLLREAEIDTEGLYAGS